MNIGYKLLIFIQMLTNQIIIHFWMNYFTLLQDVLLIYNRADSDASTALINVYCFNVIAVERLTALIDLS